MIKKFIVIPIILFITCACADNSCSNQNFSTEDSIARTLVCAFKSNDLKSFNKTYASVEDFKRVLKDSKENYGDERFEKSHENSKEYFTDKYYSIRNGGLEEYKIDWNKIKFIDFQVVERTKNSEGYSTIKAHAVFSCNEITYYFRFRQVFVDRWYLLKFYHVAKVSY